MTVNSTTIWVPRRGAAVPAPPWTEGIAGRSIGKLFVLCASLYIGIYALEAPIRYLLYLEGKDNYILARDVLMFGPLAILVVADALRLRLHPVIVAFALLVGFHGLVLIGTVHSPIGAAYGVKILINLLFGFFIAGRLISPGNKLLTFLVIVWIVTMVGILLDKFVVEFPWTGIKTIVGDINVDVSKDWEISNEIARRVAGFARSSICVAMFMPLVSVVLMCRTKNWWLRAFLAMSAIGADALTTQKGSIGAIVPVAAILCLRRPAQIPLLRVCCIVFAIVAVALPILTMDMHLGHASGVFSTESLGIRIGATWPEAWSWIGHHQLLWFGVGLGGIGGPMRFYSEANFNPADNLFVLMYAFFGIFAVAYLIALCLLVLRPVTGSEERVIPALAIVAFLLGYGAVLSVIEDQSATLFLGAAIGVLIAETRTARRRNPIPAAARS